MPDAKCDEKYVSKWLNGDMAPVKYLPTICQIFNVDIDVFIPKTHDERYQYYSEFSDKYESKMSKIAEENFKLDLTFIQALRNIIPDFDRRFPVCTPLPKHPLDGEQYRRGKHFKAAPASKNHRLFQITRDGKVQNMSAFDLKILKDIQKKVRDYVCSIFEETAADLKKREAEANRRYDELNDDIWVRTLLSEEELQNIDPYGFYTDSELKKYHLTREGIKIEEENDNGNS